VVFDNLFSCFTFAYTQLTTSACKLNTTNHHEA